MVLESIWSCHLMFAGLGYLYLLTLIGKNYVPGYVYNDMLLETLLLVLLCNLVFINILVPLTYALDSLQRLTVGALLCIVEMTFMHFAMFALHTMGDAFVLTEQVWLYVLIIIIPMTTVEFTFLRWWQKRKLKSEEDINEHQKLVEIAIEAHTKKDE